MKAIKMLMMAALTIVSVSLFAQDSTKQKAKAPKQKMEQMKYSCPMKCEGDKTCDIAGALQNVPQIASSGCTIH